MQEKTITRKQTFKHSIAVICNLNHLVPDAEKNAIRFCDAFKQSKPEVVAYLFIDTNHKTQWLANLGKSKSFNELHNSGRIKIEDSSGSNKKNINNCEQDYVSFYNPYSGINPEVYLKFIQNVYRAEVSENAIVYGSDVNQVKGVAIGKKIVSWFSDAWTRLFSGSSHRLSHLHFAVYPMKIAKDWLETLPEGASVHRNFLYLSSCLDSDKSYAPVDMVHQKVPYGSAFVNMISWFWGIWGAFFNWFIKIPLRDLKNKKPEDSIITNGKHSFYRMLFFVVAFITLISMGWMSRSYNVTWDEPGMVTYSKDVVKYLSSFGKDTAVFDTKKTDYASNQLYGMSFDSISTMVSNSTGYNIYAVRHFINALFGFLAILFAALTAKFFAGWRAGILVFIAAWCSPSFFGHCFNNPKDIPFAAGFMMSVYYMLKMLKEMPAPRFNTSVMASIGIGMALSIRAGGLLLFAFLVMFLGLHWLLFRDKKTAFVKSSIPYFRIGILVAILGYALGIALWPFALRDPLGGPLQALQEFEKFSFLYYHELFDGVRIMHKPWYYIPKLMMLTAPLFVFAGLFFFVIGLLKKENLKQWFFFGLLIFVVVFPLAYSIFKQSYVYNGWRHFLFIYPPLLALAVVGWDFLMKLSSKKAITISAMVVFLALCSLPAKWAIKNHPYEYMYFNEIGGGFKGAVGKYELDYWCQTPRAAYEWLAANHPEIDNGLVVRSNNIEPTLKTFVDKAKGSKFSWAREYQWFDASYDYAIFTNRTLSASQIKDGSWLPKGTIKTIDVDGIPIAAIVKSENKFSSDGHNYLKQSKFDSAIYFYKKAVAYNPKEEEFARALAMSYRIKWQMTGIPQCFDSALTLFKTAIALRDGNYEAYGSLGEMYLNKAVGTGTVDKAMMAESKKYFDKSCEFKVNNATSKYYLGEIYLMENNADDAYNSFQEAIAKGGQFGKAYNGLGKIYMQRGQYDSAANSFYFASELDKNDPEPLANLSQAFRKLGNNAEADKYQQLYFQKGGR